jgi:hypothetical protein
MAEKVKVWFDPERTILKFSFVKVSKAGTFYVSRLE